MNSSILVLTITFIFIIPLIAFIPYFTRKSENFGISIPQSYYHRDDFQEMRRKYARRSIILGLLLLIVLLFFYFYTTETTALIAYPVIILIYLLAGFFIYLPFHFKMKKIKVSEQWHEKRRQTIVINTNFRQKKLTISALWYFIPGVIILFTVFYSYFLYNQIPNQIPMHTDFKGVVRYDPKSFKTLMYLPLTQVFILIVMLGVHYIIGKSKQEINAENPTSSQIRNILYRRKSSLWLLWITILTEVFMAMIQISFIYPSLENYMDVLLIVFILLTLASTFFYAIKVGQGGSRIKLDEEINDAQINYDHDSYWKLGQFYVNKNDPSVFVEKRFGVGWTCNWAHPLSWVFLLGILGIPLIIALLFI